ncbi:ribosome recycling factor [Candidatus Peregrinibacteria bacterium]|nr:ribosome recycling factor [Candidatus Peregrinibacteria bacterium]
MVDKVIQQAIQSFQKSLDHLHQEFSKLQTGRANASLVEHLEVESYGARMPLKGLATILVPDAKTIAIQPWDRSLIPNIEKAIQESKLGLNPRSDGVLLRLNLPPLTEERRRELTKIVHTIAEETKIAIRQARHDGLDEMKRMEKGKEIGEDQLSMGEKKLQEKVDEFNKKVEEGAKKKETDIMTI